MNTRTWQRKRRSLRTLINYWPLVGLVVSVSLWWKYPLMGLLFITSYYYLFKDTMNHLQVVGPVYWITKNNTPVSPFVSKGFMHEISEPWRKGTGIQFRVCKHSFQIGICRKQNLDETSGVLSALQGRFLDTSPGDIGSNYKSSARKHHEILVKDTDTGD
jgi:hypothetical protein